MNNRKYVNAIWRCSWYSEYQLIKYSHLQSFTKCLTPFHVEQRTMREVQFRFFCRFWIVLTKFLGEDWAMGNNYMNIWDIPDIPYFLKSFILSCSTTLEQLVYTKLLLMIKFPLLVVKLKFFKLSKSFKMLWTWLSAKFSVVFYVFFNNLNG